VQLFSEFLKMPKIFHVRTLCIQGQFTHTNTEALAARRRATSREQRRINANCVARCRAVSRGVAGLKFRCLCKRTIGTAEKTHSWPFAQTPCTTFASWDKRECASASNKPEIITRGLK
jgi:hypothetical protein